jgi:hypothetical protein
MHIRSRVLSLSGVVLIALLVASFAVAAQDKKSSPKVDKAQQAEIASVVKIVDDVMAGQPAPSDIKFTWLTHSMRGRDGKEYVPFLLLFDKDQKLPSTLTYYIRLANKATIGEQLKAEATYKADLQKAENQAKLDPENPEFAEALTRLREKAPKIEYAFEDLKTFNLNGAAGAEFRLPAAVMAPAGEYDVYLLLKEPQASLKDKKAQPRAGMLKTTLTVPDYSTTPLMTSSILLTKGGDSPQAQQLQNDPNKNPYVFMQISPATILLEPKFDKKSWLTISFYVYNTGLDSAASEPNMTVDFAFYHKADGTEKYFNRTPQQQFNATTLAGKFDAKTGVFVGTAVPLESFPAGDYRLEIKITDKVTGKTKIQNEPFTVNAG